MDTDNQKKTGFLPICPFEIKLPEMLLNLPMRDKRLDIITESEYTDNTAMYD